MHSNTMRTKAAVAEYIEWYGDNPTQLPLTNKTYPAIRDAIRVRAGYWIMLDVGGLRRVEPLRNVINGDKFKANHVAHTKEDDKKRVAYFTCERHRFLDRVTVGRPGKYLTAHYGNHLGDLAIRDYADNIRVAATDKAEFVHFAETAQEINRAYIESDINDGWGSCMRYRPSRWNLYVSDEAVHPAQVYCGPDTRIATLEINGTIKGRCVVLDKGNFENNKQFMGAYGDQNMLHGALEEMGYERGDLNGARLSPIMLDNGGMGAPYFDGDATSCDFDGEYLIMRNYSEGEYCNPSYTVCVLEASGVDCDCCGAQTPPNDLWGTEEDGDICENCRDNDFITANNLGNEGLYNCNNTLYCESDDENYVHTQRNIEYYDLVTDREGNYLLLDDAIEVLTEDGETELAQDDNDVLEVSGYDIWIYVDADHDRIINALRLHLCLEEEDYDINFGTQINRFNDNTHISSILITETTQQLSA